jgi:hypothetical protein
MSDGWVYLEHSETGGKTSVPDDPEVLRAQEARGWVRVDPPEPVPFVPAKVNEDPDAVAAQWVTLVHPDLDARHDFPNNPDALAGAAEAGWVEPNRDGSVPKPATAKRRAAAAVAAVEEPPAAGPAAGSDSEQAESSATTVKE